MAFVDELKQKLSPKELMINEPLSHHTTFQIGGPAAYFVKPESVLKVQDVLALCKKNNVPVFVIGRGSNILASDKGFNGVVLCLDACTGDMAIEEECMRCGAGVSLISAAMSSVREGMAGLEFAAGIPGTVGGAVAMNAGAFGGEISQVLKEIEILDEDLVIRRVNASELTFSYRSSGIQEKHWIILEAVFNLKEESAFKLKKKMQELNAKRMEMQPLDYPSAGSVFKRPAEDVYPGKLIEEAGLKGEKLGGAKVSEKHANFIVNEGEAKAADVYGLITKVKQKVAETKKIDLELEIKLLGDF